MVATALPILKKIADGENLGVVRGEAPCSPFQRARPQGSELLEAAEAEYQEIHRLPASGQRGRTMILRWEAREPTHRRLEACVPREIPSLMWSMIAIAAVALGGYVLTPLSIFGPVPGLPAIMPASLALGATGLAVLNLGLLQMWSAGRYRPPPF
jgi:hypothetical protein